MVYFISYECHIIRTNTNIQNYVLVSKPFKFRSAKQADKIIEMVRKKIIEDIKKERSYISENEIEINITSIHRL